MYPRCIFCKGDLIFEEFMTRRESREAAFKVIFALSINDIDYETAIELANEYQEPILDDFAQRLVRTTFKYISPIDEILIPHLKGWSITRLSKVSLAILRFSCAQLFWWNEIDETPIEALERIVINESVEISKLFGNDEDYIYINGVLGSIVRKNMD